MIGPRGRETRWWAAALAGLAVATVWPGPARAGDAPAPQERVRVPQPPEDGDLYRLPPDCRYSSGAPNQLAIVRHQKERLEQINRRLGSRLRPTETRHFLVFSDADTKQTAQFVAWSEALYTSLLEQLGLPARERVWNGKAIVLVFAHRHTFETYSRVFDRHDARQAGAYFAIEGGGPETLNLVHLCFPLETRDARRLQELFAHEGTHAFFELYRTPGQLPLWLHEGLAEYMTTVNDPGLRPAKARVASQAARSRASIRRLFTAEAGQNLSLTQYAVAFSLVDFLLASGRPKFKNLIDALKDGMDLEGALEAAYGFGSARLERRWRAHASKGPASDQK